MSFRAVVVAPLIAATLSNRDPFRTLLRRRTRKSQGATCQDCKWCGVALPIRAGRLKLADEQSSVGTSLAQTFRTFKSSVIIMSRTILCERHGIGNRSETQTPLIVKEIAYTSQVVVGVACRRPPRAVIIGHLFAAIQEGSPPPGNWWKRHGRHPKGVLNHIVGFGKGFAENNAKFDGSTLIHKLPPS